ncbi:glutathione peroxidase [Paludibacterium paludis]|uniref:Glutathione peroxidase n=1 Tax=Paludibacterium paludis TaxID=1225769 RepID=A0A918P3M6_9NEIS|nr:glutathione peroxidase [Paludibacterium paludis]GGY17582.1 glutathione peroxidase [Paludibacterium paludis]
MTAKLYQFVLPSLSGGELRLADHAGKVMLLVNTASACGFTPQLSALEALYRRFHSQGFVVIGFPCNQFGGQDPGTEAEIGTFCRVNHGVTFPLSAKIDVNGSGAAELWRYLKREAPGVLGSRAIKWNFTKFLVDREGRVHARYAPATHPDRLMPAIERLLSE